MSDGDVYDFKVKGGLIIPAVILLVVLAFVGAMVYSAGWGEFEFNGHAAGPSERRLMLVVFPIMMSPFVYVCVHSMLKHVNEKIVWKDRQISWTDALGRERVRCAESEITGLSSHELWEGMVRYEIGTRSGGIRFLSSLPRCQDLRNRVEAHLLAKKS